MSVAVRAHLCRSDLTRMVSATTDRLRRTGGTPPDALREALAHSRRVRDAVEAEDRRKGIRREAR